MIELNKRFNWASRNYWQPGARNAAVDPTIPFLPIEGGTAVVTGTIITATTETEIVAGGETIIITLTGETWVTSGATFDGVRADILQGLDSATGGATAWNTIVRDVEGVAAVVRTSDTVVTITLTAKASYDISAQEVITVTVPASAVVLATAITATPTFTVDTAGGGPTLMAMERGFHRRIFGRIFGRVN